MSNFDRIIDRYGTNSAKWDSFIQGKKGEYLHMAVADMDFRSPEEMINKMNEIVNHGVFGYTILPESYYQSVINWFSKKHNWEIDKDWIVYSPRIGISISLIIQNITEVGDGIILQTPAYPMLNDVIVKNKRKIIRNPLILKNGKYEMNLSKLEEKIDKNTKIFLLCNPHNPTGKVFLREELEEIVEFCKKHNLILISDEIHCDLVFSPYKHIPITSISKDAENLGIVCNSITKTFNVPGVIASNLIIPNKQIREQVSEILDKAIIHNPNIFGAGITEEVYNKCEYWVEEVMNYIKKNKEYLEKYISEKIPQLEVIKSEGTYLVWVDYRKLNIPEEELNRISLEKAKLKIYTGSHFGEEGKGFIRVNLATPKKNIEEFLNRFYNVLKEEKLI